jgi:predicted Zn-dependent protease with MMP-like domain
VLDLTRTEFEELVSTALDGIPAELAQLMSNVAIFVEDDPPSEDPELLGLYEGVPLTERGEWYGGVLPDRITIYRLPILGICDTYEDAVEEVRLTVAHEIAHHFGIDDDRLHELGY